MKYGVWVGIVLAGCSSPHAAVDAGVETDGTAIDGTTTPHDAGSSLATCATPRSFTADLVSDLASDGTDLYVLFSDSGTPAMKLGKVVDGGGPPSLISAADQLALASRDGAVYYAAQVDAMFELHTLGATGDQVIGTAPAVGPIQIAGNATDLYVLGIDGATTKLWRYARAGGAPPTVVATIDGAPTSFSLATTFAAVTTTSGDWTVALPGPNTPVAYTPAWSFGLVFGGDEGFSLRRQMLTSHASSYSIVREVPTMQPVFTSTVLINGGAGGLYADTNHLFWGETSGSEAPNSTTSHDLFASAHDGTNRSALCGGWVSPVFAQDLGHVYGVEKDGARWVIDAAPKP